MWEVPPSVNYLLWEEERYFVIVFFMFCKRKMVFDKTCFPSVPLQITLTPMDRSSAMSKA